MLTDSELRELLDFQGSGPVLSIYLDTDPAAGAVDVHKLQLRSLLKEVDLPEDEEAILRYFDHEHDWSGHSAAIFSSAAEDYLHVFSLAVPIRSRARVGAKPYVKPLADLFDSYGSYGVALVDKQGVRLFHFHLGELREQEGVMGENVRRTKRGGGSQAAGQRGRTGGQSDHMAEVTGKNIKESAEAAAHFFHEKNVRRILIGGADDNVAAFRNQLPKTWQSLIVGTFPMSMVANQNEVMERAMAIGQEADRKRENQLIQTIMTEAAKNRNGVVALGPTLRAVHDGRVQTLLIRDGYRAQGSRCSGCGYLTAQDIEACPFCGEQFEVIPDAVEETVRRLMQTGGEVEVLDQEQAGAANFPDIGALLRY